jgi:photosystem II stability/assembly factor-like uncharacterized protein
LSAFLASSALLLSGAGVKPDPPGWVDLGPRSSGRVSAIAASDLNHLWAASPGGGVYKTTDGGAHWFWAGNYGLGDFTALDLVRDRNFPNRMYLRTWNGFLVSTDGAAHWQQTLYARGGDTSNFLPGEACGASVPCGARSGAELKPFTQMVLSPSESVLLTAMPCEGLHYSTNSGESFKHLWLFAGSHPELNPDNCIRSIVADEVTRRVYVATMANAPHVFRSSPGWTSAGPPPGMTWEAVDRGFIETNEPVSTMAWGGSADRLMAAVTDWSIQPSHGTAYLFNGATWAPKPFSNPDCIMSEPRPLVWGGGNDFFIGGVTFGYTINAGASWTCPKLGQQYVDIRAILADARLGRVWIGGDQSALEEHSVISSYPYVLGRPLGLPSGSTGLGISSWQAYSVAASPTAAHARRVIVGAQDIAAACSDDEGVHWTIVRTDESQSLAWRRLGSGDVLYSYSTLGTLQRSINAGTAPTCDAINFSDASPPDDLRESKGMVGPHTMAIHPTNANRIYTVSARSVIYSVNGGRSWSRASFGVAGTPAAPALVSVFVDEAGVVYVGTQDGGAYTCSDEATLCNGRPWTPWGLNGAGAPHAIMVIGESNPAPAPRTFWMGTSQGLYRRLPGAVGWTQVSRTPTYVYSDVAVDPTCSSRVYAALGYMEPMSRTRGGIEYSTNNGTSWTSLTQGQPLHNVPITQVIVSATRVLASTYGRGAWEYDWPALPPCGR